MKPLAQALAVRNAELARRGRIAEHPNKSRGLEEISYQLLEPQERHGLSTKRIIARAALRYHLNEPGQRVWRGGLRAPSNHLS